MVVVWGCLILAKSSPVFGIHLLLELIPSSPSRKYQGFIATMPNSKASTKSMRRRTHTLGGCKTCRRRHLKCDQTRPDCLSCRAVGLTCEGFSSEIRWMSPKKNQSEHQRDVVGDNIGMKGSDGTGDSARSHLYTGDKAQQTCNLHFIMASLTSFSPFG